MYRIRNRLQCEAFLWLDFGPNIYKNRCWATCFVAWSFATTCAKPRPCAMPGKRRFAASDIQLMNPRRQYQRPRALDPLSALVPDETLVAAVRPWGSAFWVFDGVDIETQLWQVQVGGPKSKLFSFQLMTTLRDALAEGCLKDVKDTESLESVAKIRVISGAPPPEGKDDPDGVGQVKWCPAVYAAGNSPQAALDLIALVLDFKVKKGRIPALPRLGVLKPGNLGLKDLSWEELDAGLPLPHPFGPGPPRGTRHVLCKLEKRDTQDDEPTYDVLFFGGIYHFRGRFDDQDIQGGMAPAAGVDRPEYVRCLQLQDTTAGRNKFTQVLEQVLLGVPVFLINAVRDPNDTLIAWLVDHESVILGETADQ